ncbi:hypothetical protein [Rickettsiella massiliensis]|uniref:hypothetical protein n=1 Tax=Rickettsiella massiliensis TaxID=676517 RepID=UPI00029A6060|nr:hypothetical protein [Rickettsiella massiliensis]
MPSVIKEIKKIKSNDLNVDKILIVLAYLDKLVYEKGNKFTRKCYGEIIKSDNPKFRLNALYLFFYYKLDDLFEKRALSKEKFINIIFQHEFPEKIVNIICVLDKHKLFCETRLEEILSLSPQDLSCLEKNLIKAHNEISKKIRTILFSLV